MSGNVIFALALMAFRERIMLIHRRLDSAAVGIRECYFARWCTWILDNGTRFPIDTEVRTQYCLPLTLILVEI